MRLHPQGIRSSLFARRAGVCPGSRILRQSPRRHRISRRARPHRKTETASPACHLSGFLPSSPRSKNPRSPAHASARHPRTRICGIARLGNLLRLRGSLQRHANGNVSRIAGGENATRPIHARPDHRNRQSRMPLATACRSRDPPYRSASPPRRRTPRPEPPPMKARRMPAHAVFCRLAGSLPLYFSASLFLLLQKLRRPSRSDGGSGEKGVASSGEKLVLAVLRPPRNSTVIRRSPRRNQFSGEGAGACLNITLPWWPGLPCVTV